MQTRIANQRGLATKVLQRHRYSNWKPIFGEMNATFSDAIVALNGCRHRTPARALRSTGQGQRKRSRIFAQRNRYVQTKPSALSTRVSTAQAKGPTKQQQTAN